MWRKKTYLKMQIAYPTLETIQNKQPMDSASTIGGWNI